MKGSKETLNRWRDKISQHPFIATYTRDLQSEDIQKLFTRDTVEAYKLFTRGIDREAMKNLPFHKRAWTHVRLVFLAFTLKLSPARRAVYALGLLFELAGLVQLARGFSMVRVPLSFGLFYISFSVPGIDWPHGTFWLLLGFLLTNLLVLLEVADRLSLKNDLDIARDIQQQMLPRGPFSAPGAVAFGRTRPANTVGGDFYDILQRPDGRILIAVGDVAGKGSPAALLMALLLAIFHTLVDEGIDLGTLAERLNVQVARHSPASRFITFFVAEFDPVTGRLDYVNAGHLPPVVWRSQTREIERWTGGSTALGMFEQAHYGTMHGQLNPGDTLVLYSDGVTEAENTNGQPFEEQGLEGVVRAYSAETPQKLADTVFRLVEQHTKDMRLSDDLTVLVLKRTAVEPA